MAIAAFPLLRAAVWAARCAHYGGARSLLARMVGQGAARCARSARQAVLGYAATVRAVGAAKVSDAEGRFGTVVWLAQGQLAVRRTRPPAASAAATAPKGWCRLASQLSGKSAAPPWSAGQQCQQPHSLPAHQSQLQGVHCCPDTLEQELLNCGADCMLGPPQRLGQLRLDLPADLRSALQCFMEGCCFDCLVHPGAILNSGAWTSCKAVPSNLHYRLLAGIHFNATYLSS